MKSGLSGIFFVMLACLLWAVDTLIRYPLLAQGISATKIVFYEHLLLVLFFIPYLYKGHKKWHNLPSSHYFYLFMVGGLGSALATLSFTWAFTLLNPSLVILLQKFQPIWAILLARPVLQEKIQGRFLFWAAVGLLGGLMISFSDIQNALSWIRQGLQQAYLLPFADWPFKKILLGHAFTMVAVMGWGSAIVFGKKLILLGHQEKDIMCGRFTMGLICLVPYFFSMESSYTLAPSYVGKVGLMVVLSGLLAMYLYYHGLGRVSARGGALAEMFFPLCAVIVNWIFLGMSLNPMQILGGVLLWISSTIIEWKHY